MVSALITCSPATTLPLRRKRPATAVPRRRFYDAIWSGNQGDDDEDVKQAPDLWDTDVSTRVDMVVVLLLISLDCLS